MEKNIIIAIAIAENDPTASASNWAVPWPSGSGACGAKRWAPNRGGRVLSEKYVAGDVV